MSEATIIIEQLGIKEAKRIPAEKLKKGTRVSVMSGPGEFLGDSTGTITKIETNRWGTTAIVHMDIGGTETTNQVWDDPKGKSGNGWYLLPPEHDPHNRMYPEDLNEVRESLTLYIDKLASLKELLIEATTRNTNQKLVTHNINLVEKSIQNLLEVYENAIHL